MRVNGSNSTVTNCYSTGSVNGESYTGGLVGVNNASGTITNCYSTGRVNGSGSAVGGLVGRMYNQSGGKSEIINSYCLSSSLDLVGVKEYRTSTGSASNNVVTNSSELSAANMKKQASFDGWNFVSVWQIEEGVTFPYLRANPQTPYPQ